MLVHYLSLPGERKSINLPEGSHVGVLFQRDEELQKDLARHLARHVANKHFSIGICRKHSKDFIFYGLIEGHMQIMNDGDTIVYSMTYGD